MTRLAGCMVVAMLALGCEEAVEDTAVAQQPEPVAPVEVTSGQPEGAPAATDDVATLRARVAELEQQLATCQGQAAPSGTETATIPEGVEVPGETPPATPAATTAEGTTRDAGTRARRRDDPSLIDTILGPDGRRRRRRNDDDDETPLGLPNPANILLGE